MVPSRFPRLMGTLFYLLMAICLGMPGAAQTQSAARPLITRPVDDSSLVTLRGNVHPLARTQFDRGPAPVSLGAQRQLLVLKRSPQQERELQQYLASLEDKNSPNFHRFLTPEQFGQQYGPAQQDVAQVVSWLSSQGFAVNKIARSGMAIEFSGSVDQLQSAFHTQIHRFVIQGREHVANVTNPMIPSALASVVAGVSPLNDFYPRPQTVLWAERPLERDGEALRSGTDGQHFQHALSVRGSRRCRHDLRRADIVEYAFQAGTNGV